MGGDLGGLANLALMVAAARRKAILDRRSAQEALAEKKADRKLREDQIKAEIKWRDQQAADQAAKPFEDSLYGPNAADYLHNLAQQGGAGAVESVLDQAEGAFKSAGRPRDLSAFRVKRPPQPMEAFVAGLPAPTGPAVAGPTADSPIYGPLGMMRPEPRPEPPPFDADAAYRERYRPSAKTQAGIDRAGFYGERVGQQGDEGAARIRNLDARTETEELLRDPKAQALLARAGLADVTAQRIALMTNPEVRRAVAEAVYAETVKPAIGRAQVGALESLPGYRAGQLQNDAARIDETGRHNRATEGLTRRGQDLTAQLGQARLKLQEKLSGVKDPLRRAVYGQLFDVLLNRTTDPLTGDQRYQFDDPERDRALAGLARMAGEDGLDLSGLGIGGGGGAPPPATRPAPTSFPSAQVNDMARRIDAGTADSFIQNAPPEVQASLRAVKQHVLSMRKTKRKK